MEMLKSMYNYIINNIKNFILKIIQKGPIPQHIGFIMDGNRRWGFKNRVSIPEAHYKGAKNIENILKVALKIGIEEITIFAFSSENWKRSKDEVNNLMILFERFLIESGNNLKMEIVKAQSC